ncbi:MAG: hypothetical protein AAGC84_14135 [Pseudomonas sp.]
MAELRHEEAQGGLYERLLHRLAIALDEADSDSRWQNKTPQELELRGLSPAELELIRAYLDRDLHWLRGWHAAAKELALIEQSPAPTIKAPRSLHIAKIPRTRGVARHRQKLLCALCGSVAFWRPGEGVQPCSACGSQLFRASKPR